MKKVTIATFATLAAMTAGVSAQTSVSADITTDTTWSGEIVLENPIFVKGATLTILPGTIVRGQPRTAAVVPGSTVGTPGALVVTQSGRINAAGGSTAPIIFTTAAVDNNSDGVADDNGLGFFAAWSSGDTFLDADPLNAPLAPLNGAGDANVSLWGGIVVLGNAPTNLGAGAVAAGQATVEGLTVPGFPVADATYGGTQPNDSSGILSYVSVRHAGDEIGEGNELNGITLAGVGAGTQFDHIEVYCNFDDGIEWFGGTVDGSYLHVAFAGDDGFDIDQGYTGTNQFCFGVAPFFNENDGDPYGSASGDKGGEWDGEDFAEGGANVNYQTGSGAPWPQSNAQFYNLTHIGSTPDGTNPADSSNSANRGIQMRNGFAGGLWNSVIINTGAAALIDVTDGDGSPAGFATETDYVADGLVYVVSTTLDDGPALGGGETTALANGDTLAMTLGGTAASVNVVNSALFPGLVNEDSTFDPDGGSTGLLPAKGTKLDPRLGFGLSGVAGGVFGGGAILDTSASYRGAFSAAPVAWTTGWTALNKGGVLAD